MAGIAIGTATGLWQRSDPDTRAVGSFDSSGETSTAPPGAPVRGSADGTQIGWTTAGRRAVEPDRVPPQEETFSDAKLVRLASDMRTWRAGTRVAFDIPHTGTTIESVIERVETGLAGSTSYIGRHVGQDAPHRMVVTVGARNAFAYIGSAQGGYEMVGNREYGWLMTSAGMDRHVDYSKPDYYVPGETQRANP